MPRNAVASHLAMSMQKQRDMSQDLLRICQVRLEGLRRQARKGARYIDDAAVGRLVGDLATLQRVDAVLMLQVGRLSPNAGDVEVAEGARRAADAVGEYASQWERDRASFRPADDPKGTPEPEREARDTE